jgi:lipoyl(octanoyl) transferase 2
MRLAVYKIAGIIHYHEAAKLQEQLASNLLSFKATATSKTPAPDPAIITAQFQPIYTCGRREIGTVNAEQQRFLRANGKADFVETLRGGQTTFHGPGQLISYPIIDLKRHKISPRDYVCLLEKSLIATCARFGIKAFSTENPGVWTTADKKIGALGIHLRRNVTSHGIGLNINTDLWWFDRIVACGLEGKKTTSFEAEGVSGRTVEEVGDVFVDEFARKLGTNGYYRAGPL